MTKTNAELRKALVLELNERKPNKEKIAELERLIAESDLAAASINIQTFNAVYGEPEPMQDCKVK